jgi:GntR family transcriptional regulator
MMPGKKPRKSSTTQTVDVNPELRFKPLNKKSFTPMYFQIEEQLLKLISSGQLRPGDLLPSEEELSRAYGVSRMTSRQALQGLKSSGHASRYKGRGTFVIQPKVEKDITHLAGFTAEMRALGLKATSRVLATETIPATVEIATKLAGEVGMPTYRLRRLRFADELPFAIEEIYLSKDRYPGIDEFDFSRLSLYATLRERYGIRLSLADEILEARAATRNEAELLEVPARSSLLVISRTLWSVEGQPVEAARSFYRGDRYRAVLRIPATIME